MSLNIEDVAKATLTPFCHQSTATEPGISLHKNSPTESIETLHTDTPLMKAVLSKDPKRVMECIQEHQKNKTLEETLKVRDVAGLDVILLALHSQQYDIAEMLLKFTGDLESPDEQGETRLMRCIKILPDQASQILIKYGTNINAKDAAGDTLLVQAIRNNEDILVRYLLDHRADITCRDAEGNTLIEIVENQSGKQNKKIAELLRIHRQPTLPIDYVKMFDEALRKGDCETLGYAIFALGEDYLTNPFGEEKLPLHLAAQLGCLDIVKMLVTILNDRKQSVDVCDAKGNTAFMLATAAGHSEVTQFLADENCNVHHQNHQGKTAEMLASEEGHVAIVRYIESIVAEDKRQEELDTMMVPKENMERDSFLQNSMEEIADIIPEILQVKGLALILENYYQKNKKKGVITGRGYVADNPETFKKALSLLNSAKDGTEFVLYTRVDGHFVTVKCERLNGKNHIILMDSIGSEVALKRLTEEQGVKNYTVLIENVVASVFSETANNTFFYKNREARQLTPQGCDFFVLKDGQKMQKTPCFSTEIRNDGHIMTKEKHKNGLTVFSYRTPSRFMRLAQSRSMLENYVGANRKEAEKLHRVSKKGDAQNMMQYALHQRENFCTMFKEKASESNHGGERSKEPKFLCNERVIYNNSTFYFGFKYRSIIESALKKCPQKKLGAMVKLHDAAFLKVGLGGTVMTAREEALIMGKDKENIINSKVEFKDCEESKAKALFA